VCQIVHAFEARKIGLVKAAGARVGSRLNEPPHQQRPTHPGPRPGRPNSAGLSTLGSSLEGDGPGGGDQVRTRPVVAKPDSCKRQTPFWRLSARHGCEALAPSDKRATFRRPGHLAVASTSPPSPARGWLDRPGRSPTPPGSATPYPYHCPSTYLKTGWR